MEEPEPGKRVTNPFETEPTPGLIAVALDVPAGIFTMPGGNMIGRHLLSHVFASALRASGIYVRISAAGQLNRADFLILVTDLSLGLRIIKAELAATNLSCVATIGWWCSAEQIWRCSFPHSGIRIDPIAREVEHEQLVQFLSKKHESP